MMRSIEIARNDPMLEKRPSKTNGLRVIKTFERVNGMAFDPFDKSHRRMIAGHAGHEAFFRMMRLFFKKEKEKYANNTQGETL
jgi:hypothetical protein